MYHPPLQPTPNLLCIPVSFPTKNTLPLYLCISSKSHDSRCPASITTYFFWPLYPYIYNNTLPLTSVYKNHHLQLTSVFLHLPQQPTSQSITTHFTHALYTWIIPYKLLYWPLYPCNTFHNLLLASVSPNLQNQHASVLLFQCIPKPVSQ